MNTLRPANAGAYLYCLTPAAPFTEGTPALERAGIGGATPRVLRVADLAAIVSDSPYPHYDISRANLLAHEAVIEEVMARADVLPVRFGTVAESDAAIQDDLLRHAAAAVRQQLQRVRGCVELGVKALWHAERLFAEIAEGDAAIRALRDELAGHDPTATYYQQIQLGELVAGAIEQLRDWEADHLLGALAPLARETQTNPPQTDLMALNASFLVPRGVVGACGVRVEALRQAQRHRLIVKDAGPLPPYSFVDLAWGEEPAAHGITH